jgi:hypothetical protein
MTLVVAHLPCPGERLDPGEPFLSGEPDLSAELVQVQDRGLGDLGQARVGEPS